MATLNRYGPVSRFLGTVRDVLLVLLFGFNAYGKERAGTIDGRLLLRRVSARTRFPVRHATSFTVTFQGDSALAAVASFEYVRLMHQSSRGLKRMRGNVPLNSGELRLSAYSYTGGRSVTSGFSTVYAPFVRFKGRPANRRFVDRALKNYARLGAHRQLVMQARDRANRLREQ